MGRSRARFAAYVALVGASLVSIAAARPSFDFKRSAGAFEARADTIWAVFADSTVAPGDSVTLIEGFERPPREAPGGQPQLRRAVVHALDRGRACAMIGDDAVTGCRLRLIGPNPLAAFAWGFAMRAPIQGFRVVGSHVESDLDGDGIIERYTECASFEGVHLEIWKGAPFVGTELADIYFYAGYDTEPTCPGLDSLRAAWYGEDSTSAPTPPPTKP